MCRFPGNGSCFLLIFYRHYLTGCKEVAAPFTEKNKLKIRDAFEAMHPLLDPKQWLRYFES